MPLTDHLDGYNKWYSGIRVVVLYVVMDVLRCDAIQIAGAWL